MNYIYKTKKTARRRLSLQYEHNLIIFTQKDIHANVQSVRQSF